ncbi:MAG: tRNA (N6-threonylcarbamoyladenosine(37)-N6)-methyltransferase TrmO [Deltaproteobacteria bacterium]|nr:tRNA (N6-threonylcarbamoyladenosine(37)-N6)-methyltransferase TrmO [Deltaproteobacteria bacterium]
MEFSFKPIGIIDSCFKEKFGIPRQPGLATEARAILKVFSPFDQMEAFKGLDDFSHIWIIFVFHSSMRDNWKATVRPPRLGGNRRTGVFSTRSGFRPNPIGMSAVRLEKIVREKKETRLYLSGIDLMDGTPVLDIKPYLPYADAIFDASGGFASSIPEALIRVNFSPEARAFCLEKEQSGYPGLTRLIEQLLKMDPRPAYYTSTPQKSHFGMKLYGFNVLWETSEGAAYVTACEDGSESQTKGYRVPSI